MTPTICLSTICHPIVIVPERHAMAMLWSTSIEDGGGRKVGVGAHAHTGTKVGGRNYGGKIQWRNYGGKPASSRQIQKLLKMRKLKFKNNIRSIHFLQSPV